MSLTEKYLTEGRQDSDMLADTLTRFFLGNKKTALRDLNKENNIKGIDPFNDMLDQVMEREDWSRIHNKLWDNMISGFSKTIEHTIATGNKMLK